MALQASALGQAVLDVEQAHSTLDAQPTDDTPKAIDFLNPSPPEVGSSRADPGHTLLDYIHLSPMSVGV